MRSIIQAREVSQDIETARREYRLVEEAIMALEWFLARTPEAGIHRSGIYWVYRQKGFKAFKTADITILYSFTDDEVTIEAIVFRKAA